MAQDKNSIIVYADWINKFEALEDDEAGRLIKHFFRYVNDKNPVAPDRITELSFIDIEASLKRDLKKWEKTKIGRSKAGQASAESRRLKKEDKQKLTNSTNVKSVKQNSTNSTVSVNGSVSVNDIVNDIEKDKKEILLSWLEYRKEIKKPINVTSTLRTLAMKFNANSVSKCKSVVNASIENNWVTLFWDKETQKPITNSSPFNNPIF